MSASPISEAQLAANRANAQFCTGPKTESGKARSSQNAMKDGLFASHAIVSSEDRPYYEALTQDLFEEMFPTGEPAGPSDLFHHNQIVLAMWNINRAERMKTKIYEETGEDPLDPTTPAVQARYERLDKAIARLERTYNRFFKLFRQRRKEYEKQLEQDTADYFAQKAEEAEEAEEAATGPEQDENQEAAKQNHSPYQEESQRIDKWLRASIYAGIQMYEEPVPSEIPAILRENAA